MKSEVRVLENRLRLGYSRKDWRDGIQE